MPEVTRDQIEEFLFEEADLLDSWRLPEWLTLFADDRVRLGERVKRLMKRTSHVEYPHSKTRHMFGNIRVKKREDKDLDVSCVFATYRTKDGITDVYVGTNKCRILPADGSFKIRNKRCVVDSDALRPSDRISIIL